MTIAIWIFALIALFYFICLVEAITDVRDVLEQLRHQVDEYISERETPRVQYRYRVPKV